MQEVDVSNANSILLYGQEHTHSQMAGTSLVAGAIYVLAAVVAHGLHTVARAIDIAGETR